MEIAEYNAQNVVDVGGQQRPSDLSRPISVFLHLYTYQKNKQTHKTETKTKTKQCRQQENN